MTARNPPQPRERWATTHEAVGDASMVRKKAEAGCGCRLMGRGRVGLGGSRSGVGAGLRKSVCV